MPRLPQKFLGVAEVVHRIGSRKVPNGFLFDVYAHRLTSRFSKNSKFELIGKDWRVKPLQPQFDPRIRQLDLLFSYEVFTDIRSSEFTLRDNGAVLATYEIINGRPTHILNALGVRVLAPLLQ